MASLKPLVTLLGALLLSVLLYVAAGALLLKRPITYDSIERMMARKVSYGMRQPSPKLVLIGGSGVRTSHFCSVFAPELKMPCVNGGSTVGLSLDFSFEAFKPFLHRGDTVYMPLEYQQYAIPRAEVLTGPDAAILFRRDWTALMKRGPEGFVRAAFMADLEFATQSVIEQVLAAGGVKARFDKQQSDEFGDQTGLTHEAGKTYDAFIAHTKWRPIAVDGFTTATGAKDDIAGFLDWCRANGIHVVGGLPVAFADRPISQPLIEALRDFYAAHGAGFVVMNNRSQYPRAFFYDTPFHLEEEHAIEHSRRLVPYLRSAIGRGVESDRTAPAEASGRQA